MFTGIVQEIGTVREAGEGYLLIECRKVLRNSKLGDSISVNGVDVTVVQMDEGSFRSNLMQETYARSTLGDLQSGDRVNLEAALMAGERMGGHYVQGHVDGTVTVAERDARGDDLILRLKGQDDLMRYVVENGSVCLDGVSLTVTARDSESFAVSLVRYTQEHTTLTDRQPGDRLNLEVDILAKYVEQLLQPYGGARN
jgi:riboflavin synthase